MPWFPMFTDLAGRPCLIIGGGAVAARKAEKLLPFGPRLLVAAPEIAPELRNMPGVTCLEQPFSPELITDDLCLVIAASDDAQANREAAEVCRRRRIPVNVVDCREECSFIFPALVRRGELTVGISTGGASPTAAIYLKEQISGLLPENTEDILRWLDAWRPRVREHFAQADRRAVFQSLFARALTLGRPLSPEETEAFLTDSAMRADTESSEKENRI